MGNGFIEEREKLVARLEELKERISESFCSFVGYDIPVCELEIEQIIEEQDRLIKNISIIDRELSDESEERDKSEFIQLREEFLNKYKLNELYLLPGSDLFGKNYHSIDTLLVTIKFFIDFADDKAEEKLKNYYNALTDFNVTEEKLPYVISIILDDYVGIRRVNLSEEIPKVLQTSTPINKEKIPSNN